MMTFNEFQDYVVKNAVNPEMGQSTCGTIAFCGLGLAGEAGEVANKIKKLHRDGDTPEMRDKIKDELSDVLFYAAQLADKMYWTFEDVAAHQVLKLAAANQRKKNESAF